MPDSLRILVAPLNWGLGHATRSIPLIRLLEEKGCKVILASDGPALALLKKEFPHAPAHELPGIEVRYGERFFALALAQQMPALLRAIRKERRVIKSLVEKEAIDGLISDNRFGSWGAGVPDVVLSHQWTVETGHPLSRPLATALHRRILRHYDQCWIPDDPGEAALAGRLSRNEDRRTTHIGPLSRLRGMEAATRASDRTDADLDLNALVICSGPEPLRTRLEEAVVAQAVALPFNFTIARGLPGADPGKDPAKHVRMRSHLDAAQMKHALANADVVVSRTGYTTLMDLAATGSKALLIPTPGQPEQEYLARHLAKKGWWTIQHQDKLDLRTGIEHAMASSRPPLWKDRDHELQRAMDTFLDRCRATRGTRKR